jgi:hypothetical protein
VCPRSGTLKEAQTLSIAVVEGPDRADAESESLGADFLDLLEDAVPIDQ